MTDKNGNTVNDVKLSFKDTHGKLVAGTETAGSGEYRVEHLGAGEYTAILEPRKTGIRGSTVVLHLADTQVLCVNWVVSPTAEPLAVPQVVTSAAMCKAADPPSDAFIAAAAGGAVALVGGIAAGGCAAAGCFSGESHTKKSLKRLGD